VHYLELALRVGLPLATLDVDLVKAARKAGVPRFDA
jgi:predicted nucleic acid-binding protein